MVGSVLGQILKGLYLQKVDLHFGSTPVKPVTLPTVDGCLTPRAAFLGMLMGSEEGPASADFCPSLRQVGGGPAQGHPPLNQTEHVFPSLANQMTFFLLG